MNSKRNSTNMMKRLMKFSVRGAKEGEHLFDISGPRPERKLRLTPFGNISAKIKKWESISVIAITAYEFIADREKYRVQRLPV